MVLLGPVLVKVPLLALDLRHPAPPRPLAQRKPQQQSQPAPVSLEIQVQVEEQVHLGEELPLALNLRSLVVLSQLLTQVLEQQHQIYLEAVRGLLLVECLATKQHHQALPLLVYLVHQARQHLPLEEQAASNSVKQRTATLQPQRIMRTRHLLWADCSVVMRPNLLAQVSSILPHREQQHQLNPHLALQILPPLPVLHLQTTASLLNLSLGLLVSQPLEHRSLLSLQLPRLPALSSQTLELQVVVVVCLEAKSQILPALA